MKKLLSLTIVIMIAFSSVSLMSDETANDGKDIYMSNKCANCHSIEALEIEAKMAKSKAPDLSTLSEELTTKENLISYMKKELEVGGKKHMMPFKGSDEDLDKLAEWLISIK